MLQWLKSVFNGLPVAYPVFHFFDNQPLHLEALRSARGKLLNFPAAAAFSMLSQTASYSEIHKTMDHLCMLPY